MYEPYLAWLHALILYCSSSHSLTRIPKTYYLMRVSNIVNNFYRILTMEESNHN
jgi:hypothetical protein